MYGTTRERAGHPLLRRRSARRSHRLTSAAEWSQNVAKARKSSGKSARKGGGAKKAAARKSTGRKTARKGTAKKAGGKKAAKKTAKKAARKTARKAARRAPARKAASRKAPARKAAAAPKAGPQHAARHRRNQEPEGTSEARGSRRRSLRTRPKPWGQATRRWKSKSCRPTARGKSRPAVDRPPSPRARGVHGDGQRFDSPSPDCCTCRAGRTPVAATRAGPDIPAPQSARLGQTSSNLARDRAWGRDLRAVRLLPPAWLRPSESRRLRPAPDRAPAVK